MRSLILRTAARYLIPLLLLISIFLLIRGHNAPGGGFVGGLTAATAFVLYALAWEAESARRLIGLDAGTVIGTGLAIALGSGLVAPLTGGALFESRWFEPHLPGFGPVPVGTPLFFDVGVYLVVAGATVLLLLELQQES